MRSSALLLFLASFITQANECNARLFEGEENWTKIEIFGYMGLPTDSFDYICKSCEQDLSIRVNNGNYLSKAYDFYDESDFLNKTDSNYSKLDIASLSVSDLKHNNEQKIHIISTDITSFTVLGQKYIYLHYEAKAEPVVEGKILNYIGFVTAREGYTCNVVITYKEEELTTISKVRISSFMNNLII